MPRNPGEYYHLRPPLTEECWSRIADAERLIIYSLSSDNQSYLEGPGILHGYTILKQVDIVDLQTIADVYSSLRAGSEEGTLGIRCFIPHHGVRAICGESTLDLVICFSCTNMMVSQSSEGEAFMADISRKPEALLDELLEEVKSDSVGE